MVWRLEQRDDQGLKAHLYEGISTLTGYERGGVHQHLTPRKISQPLPDIWEPISYLPPDLFYDIVYIYDISLNYLFGFYETQSKL